ncbi:hypothetical protein HK099_008649 [Clydaea vesicula]|uniref:Guanylate kinase n=1 Tax=Clydaea vesicula TaxID=447962 RepID=A0AAD5TVK5_9FUNG|nr:hypothetical protein HK099_008649 [Clydaea vesicula]
MSSIKKTVLVISGPSGVGKSTLLEKLFKKYPNSFGFSVSHTTRSPRPGEIDGKSYNFVSKEKIDEEIKSNKFIEYTEFSGNTYGTSIEAVTKVQEQNKVCVLDVELNGIKNLKKMGIPAKFVFISPPSVEDLEKRLRGRGTETEESLQKRLASAKAEMEYASLSGSHDITIVNDSPEKAFEKLEKFVLTNWQTILVISGPSGVGKSTLLDQLFKKYQTSFGFSVSHTTRSPRPGETNGTSYNFVSKTDFLKEIAENKFIEHTEFSGNHYGTSMEAVKKVQEEKKICVLDVELNGIKSIKKLAIPAKFVFIAPPSIKDLEIRLRSRGTETEESLKKRLDAAKAEMEYASLPDAHDIIIINDTPEKAFQKLDKFISENWG